MAAAIDPAAWASAVAIEWQTHGLMRRDLGRLTLRGNIIWGPGKPPGLYLDGDIIAAVFDRRSRRGCPRATGAAAAT